MKAISNKQKKVRRINRELRQKNIKRYGRLSPQLIEAVHDLFPKRLNIRRIAEKYKVK